MIYSTRRSRQTGFADNLSRSPIQSERFVAEEAPAGELRQSAQIDVDLIIAVMSGHVAGQHPRVRRMRIAANHGQTHAGRRLHAEASQDTDVTVATADEDDVAKDRLIRLEHAWLELARRRCAGQAGASPARTRHERETG